MKLFRPLEQTPSPRFATFRPSSWWTWSDEARNILEDFHGVMERCPAPDFVHLTDGAEYDHTYTLDSGDFLSDRLRAGMRDFAVALQTVSVPGGRAMLSNLFGENVSGRLIHRVFALQRHLIAEKERAPFSALYAPLGMTGLNAGEFRLHSDLYPSEMLLNIFDDVPSDGSGASTFLRVADFQRIVARCEAIPPGVREQIRNLFRAGIQRDRFREFMDLVHGKQNPWCERLWEAMSASQEMIVLEAGQGYLVHDCLWLHGRTPPSGGVSDWRAHRLTFRAREESRSAVSGGVC